VSLEHILLGLCRTPSSGYDLKQVFDVAIRYFWPAELSQVYPALKHLERRRLLKSRVVPSKKGPKRRVYQTTAAGRAALRKWLAAGPAFRDERYVFGAQVFLLDALGDLEQSATFVRRLRDELERRWQSLRAIETEDAGFAPPPEALSAQSFHEYLCLRLGLRVLEARMAWCDEALEMIHRRQRPARKE
jgi:PadR family transcriptional regulator AphA